MTSCNKPAQCSKFTMAFFCPSKINDFVIACRCHVNTFMFHHIPS